MTIDLLLYPLLCVRDKLDLLLYHVALRWRQARFIVIPRCVRDKLAANFFFQVRPLKIVPAIFYSCDTSGGLKNVMNLLSRLSASFALAPLSRQSRFIMTASIIDGKVLAQ
jgi:hypothetical protein